MRNGISIHQKLMMFGIMMKVTEKIKLLIRAVIVPLMESFVF